MYRFFICEHCKNIVGKINDSGVPIVCCGEDMKELEAGTVEASKEKHIPVVIINQDLVTVEVGSIIHPMTEDHYIDWIYLETKNGGQRKKCLNSPKVTFSIYDDEAIAVYAYCNLHGLWKKEI